MNNKSSQVAIGARYIIVLVVAVSILLMFGGFFYYSFEEKSITKHEHEEIKAIADMKIRQITQWRKEKISDTQIVSHSTFFAKGIIQWEKDKTNKILENEIINNLMSFNSNNDYEDILLINLNGELLLSNNSKEYEIGLYTRSKILDAVKSNQIVSTYFYYCALHKKIHYDIIAPVEDAKKNPIAVIIFRIDPNIYLYPLVQSWPTASKTAETLIVGKDGDSVLFMNELRNQKNTAFKLRIPLTRTNVPAVKAVLGLTGTSEGIDYRGMEVLSYYRPIPDTPWFMVSKIDKSEIFAELRFRAVVISLFTLVLIVLAGVGLALILKVRQKNIYRKLLDKEKELRANQEEYKTTLYSIGNAVITTDVNGAIRQMNPVAEQLTGWKETEVKGITIDKVFMIINEETRNLVENPVIKVLKEGVIVGLAINTLLISKDGKEIPVADSGAPIKNESGEITGMVLVFRDITEHRQAEDALQANEAFLNTLLNAIPIPVFYKDLNGQYLGFNDAFEIFFGKTRDQLIGKSVFDINPQQLAEIYFSKDRELIESKGSQQYDSQVKNANGLLKDVIFNKAVFTDNQGAVIGLIGTILDITERKHTEKVLKENEAHLHELNATKDKFFSIIAHDLKNPFNSIIGFSNLLVEKVQDKDYNEMEEFVGYILESSNSAMNLLLNLLEWSRSQTGKMEFSPKTVEIRLLIDEVIRLLNVTTQQKSITISCEDLHDATVTADKNMISTILRNLISNAIKYTHPGGKIVLSAEQKPDEWVFSVSDNGVGIKKEAIEKLFRIDENNSTPGTQNETGTGLGLILCKEFVKKHGGKIWVESEVGIGSAFYFTIPIR